MKNIRRIVGLFIAVVLVLPVAAAANADKRIALWNKTGECVVFTIIEQSSRAARRIDVPAATLTGNYDFHRGSYSIYIESGTAGCSGTLRPISNTIYLSELHPDARASYYGGHNGLTYLEYGSYR